MISKRYLKSTFHKSKIFLLGKDKGVKVGAGRAVDSLCENGYLKHKKQPDGNVELIKLNGEIE